MDCDELEFVLCTISTNNNDLAQNVTGTNKVTNCPSSSTQDEYNDLYGDVIVTEMVTEKVLDCKFEEEDEEKITHKVKADEEKITHKVKADKEKITHKVKADEEKITHKVKVNEKGTINKVMAIKITNKNKETNKNKIEGKTELGLINLKFPDNVQLLNDLNIWIGDTAATVHMTPYSVGMIQQKINDSNQGITVGNGTQEKTIVQGTIKGNIVNKNGVKLGVAMLTDVSYAPTLKFNLCSLSKLMVNGWKMEGDASCITMKKKGRVLIFDIVVRTTTGLVFCMYLERVNNEFSFSTITNRVPWSLLEAH